MKRSEINAIMKDALNLFKEYKISLPEFVLWTAEDWKTKGEETQEIKDNILRSCKSRKRVYQHCRQHLCDRLCALCVSRAGKRRLYG